MNTRSMLTYLALLAAACGAAAQEKAEIELPFEGDPPANACSDGYNDTECVIELRVEDKEAKSCSITLLVPSQDLVTFSAGFKDKFVYWRIKEQPAGKPYRFGLRDGIHFVNDPRPRTFVALQRSAKDPASFRAKNKRTRVTVFEYVINVTNETDIAAPTRECSLDPWFRNR